MRTHLKELVVFMASPGDLVEERDVIRSTEDSLNNLLASNGIRVRVVGWELTTPGYGRPQAQINPMVHECDVFIGLLNRRWGSPTGEYSSGFEEEFTIALERRRGGESPAIGMFFASLNPDLLSDPGPQLAQVLNFKDRIRGERVALYEEFRSPEHLETLVLRFLMNHVLPLLVGTGASNEGAKEQSSPPRGETAGLESRHSGAEEEREDANEGPTRPALGQVSETLEAFLSLLRGQPPSTRLDVDRLALIGRAFEETPELLGNHLVNRLYRGFDAMDLIRAEANIWLRTFFADIGRNASIIDRNVPGWALLDVHETSPEAIDSELVSFARDADPSVAGGAIQILGRLGKRPAEIWSYEHRTLSRHEEIGTDIDAKSSSLQAWLDIFDALPGVEAGFDYLLSRLQPSDASLLAALSNQPKLNKTSKVALDALQDAIRGEFDSLASLAPSLYSRNSDTLTNFLVDNIGKLSVEGLRGIARSGKPKLRRSAIKQLLDRDDLKGSSLQNILSWKDREALQMVIDKASVAPPFGEVVLEIVAKETPSTTFPDGLESKLLSILRTPEELRALYEDSPFNYKAWAALALQLGRDMLMDARQLLDSDAADFRERLDSLDADHQGVIEFMAEQIRASACVLIGEVGGGLEDEIRLAKEVAKGLLTSPKPALSALSKIARPEHFSDIGEMLTSLDQYGFVEVVEDLMASNLAGLLAEKWKTAEVSALREAAARWLITRPERTDRELVEALHDPLPHVRMAALENLVPRLSRDQLKVVLENYYRGNETYWYNVIVGIDEAIFGPHKTEAADPKP